MWIKLSSCVISLFRHKLSRSTIESNAIRKGTALYESKRNVRQQLYDEKQYWTMKKRTLRCHWTTLWTQRLTNQRSKDPNAAAEEGQQNKANRCTLLRSSAYQVHKLRQGCTTCKPGDDDLEQWIDTTSGMGTWEDWSGSQPDDFTNFLGGGRRVSWRLVDWINPHPFDEWYTHVGHSSSWRVPDNHHMDTKGSQRIYIDQFFF